MDSQSGQVWLQPPLIHTASQHVALTLTTAFAPHANSIALARAPLAVEDPSAQHQQQQQRPFIYAAQYLVDHSHTRPFTVQSYTLFASLQKIAQDSHSAITHPTPDQLSYYHRIIRLYQHALVQQLPLIQADPSLSPSSRANQLTHHADLHSILSLTQLLYLPNDHRGDGLVGEELLDWVNTVDSAPSTEEGQQLADASRPWQHPNFWPYLYRCILRAHLLSASSLLSLLASSHPSHTLRSLATLAVDLLTTFPRSTAFRTEQEFLAKCRTWKLEATKADSFAQELYAQAEQDEILAQDQDLRLDFETSFRTLFDLLNGSESRVLEVAEDWREALGAWGVWVNPGARRQGIPATLQLITKSHPVDSTLPSEAVQSSLFLGDVPRALQQSNLLSIWLVAHLSDLLHHLGVLETPPPPSTHSASFQTDLRTHFLLSYADTLQADPSLWRITVEYLAACGEVGRARIRGVIRGVVLSSEEAELVAHGDEEVVVEGGLEKENNEPAKEGEGEREREKRQPSVVEEVLRVCSEQGLEEEMISICKVWSEQLIAEKRYGEAVSFCVRAGDSKRIARIADRVLDEYVVHGQESFIHHVDSIPTSLLRPPSSSLHRDLFGASPSDDGLTSASRASSPMPSDEGVQTPFSSKLSFLARYRDFFAFYARGDRRQAAGLLVLLLTSGVAPKSFYAVMLLDVLPLLESSISLSTNLLITPSETYELLRILEELTAPISATGVDIYGHLNSLARLLGAGEESGEKKTEKSLKQLEVVRAELARHLGRCCCL